MDTFMFGLTSDKPTRAAAKRMDRICREEGGLGFIENNVKPNTSPGIANGRYHAWFTAPNRGNPFNEDMARRVRERIAAS